MKHIIVNVKSVLMSPFSLFDKAIDRLLFAAGMFIFCILFLYVFVPFNISEWIVYTSPFKDLKLVGVGLVGGSVIVLSQLIQFWYFVFKKMKVYHLLGGFVFDSFFASVPLSFLYSVPANSYLTEFWETFQLVFLLLALWYLIGLTLLALVQIKKEKKEIVSSSLLKRSVLSTDLISVCDDNGQQRISLKPEDLLFFESADNYVIVYFKKEQRIGKEVIRIPLKNIESDFLKYNCIRCHRSYIVNMDNVSSIKKEGRTYEIAIQGTLLIIPVSRSYVNRIKDLLQK